MQIVWPFSIQRLSWAAVFFSSACSGPPAELTIDASVPTVIDARMAADGMTPIDSAPATIDASVFDASSDASSVVDASPPDAAPADASPIDAGPPPPTISLVDVTLDEGYDFLGGQMPNPDPWALGSGAAVADFDGDGDLDIFLARCDRPSGQGGRSTILYNDGASTGFVSLVPDAALEAAFIDTCAHGVTAGDYDRDGDPDLFVTLNGPDRLLRNDGGSFVDVAAIAGVTGPTGDLNAGAHFADLNRDGLLDLYVLAHATTIPPEPSALDANRTYINRGDGTFIDISGPSGAAGQGSSQAVAIADLDNDGDLEIYVANDRYAINGNFGNEDFDGDQWLDLLGYDAQNLPTYQDMTAAYETDGMRSAMGVALSDLDGDERLEIFVSDWGSNHLQMWNSTLGVYEDHAASWRLQLMRHSNMQHQVSWHAEFTDLDRDGREEFLLINGSVYEPLSCASWSQLDYYFTRELVNDRFKNITSEVSWPPLPSCPPTGTHPISGRGAVFADLDGDHDDDLIVTPFIESYRFFRNDTNITPAHFLRVVPRGTVSAPTPYGAKLVVMRPDGVIVRRWLYAGGTLAERYPLLEAGLQDQTAVVEASLHWPSGYVQRLDLTPGFALDTTWHVTEPEWLTLSQRVAGSLDPAPMLSYRPVDQTGAFLGSAGAGRSVTAIRSDGVPVTVTDHGDGSYSAPLPHPGSTRITVVQLSDDGATLPPRLSVYYQ